MNIYTGAGLVRHAEKALALKTKYMWGGIMRPITPAYISALRSMYGTKAGTGYTAARYAELERLAGKGYFGCDCVGLIKSYYWSGNPEGGTGSPKYGAAGFPDVNAGAMWSAASVKGAISTLPERPGVIVYCKSHPHVGIYAGNGEVIECTLGIRGDGVVRTKLSAANWEYWFECPYIGYPEQAVTAEASLKKCMLSYPAVVRSKPSPQSARLGRYLPGSTVTVVQGSDKKDAASGLTYVRLAGEPERWIVKTAV